MSTLLAKPTEPKRQRFLAVWLPLWLMAIGCYLCGFLSETETGYVAQWTPLVIAALASVVLCLWFTGKLTWRRLIVILMIAGFALRIAYVLYTGYRVRQHDVWSVTANKGHMGYIQYIAHNLALPDTNETWQFYHPPLHHIIAGILYRILEKGGMEPTVVAEKLQLLTMFYSCALMVVCDRLFAALRLSDRARALADAVIAFHPTFLLVGGGLNNDMLCALLGCVSLLFFVKWWYDNSRTGYLALCGLFLGLSMMAKVSGVMLAFPYAAAFLWKLWQQRKESWPLMRQYLIFGLIAVPVGMWYPVRNLLLFGQSFSYVPYLGDNSKQYIGDHSVLERLFGLSSAQIASPYQTITKDSYNIPLSMFKTSLFGEADMKGGIFAHLLFVSAVVLALVALVHMLRQLSPKTLRQDSLHAVWTVMWGALMFSYVLFCLRYPHVCSQDFRYLTLLLPVAALYLGKLLDDDRSKLTQGLLWTFVGVFGFSSTMVYALPMVW
ncbi:MAG: glycosyltransferase family 39 protein [Clostridia bacterium]|nr:glycosyltransferase family 39 protein [Clostridia bacterium]